MNSWPLASRLASISRYRGSNLEMNCASAGDDGAVVPLGAALSGRMCSTGVGVFAPYESDVGRGNVDGLALIVSSLARGGGEEDLALTVDDAEGLSSALDSFTGLVVRLAVGETLRAGAAPAGRAATPMLGELGGEGEAIDAVVIDVVDWLLLTDELARAEDRVRMSESAMCEAWRENVGGVWRLSAISTRRPGEMQQ